MKLLEVENQAAYETIATMHHSSVLVKNEYLAIVSTVSASLLFLGVAILYRVGIGSSSNTANTLYHGKAERQKVNWPCIVRKLKVRFDDLNNLTYRDLTDQWTLLRQVKKVNVLSLLPQRSFPDQYHREQ